jgi:hypothetical protein
VGTGPASANKGDTITISSGLTNVGGTNNQATFFTFDRPVKLTLLTIPGYVLHPDSTPTTTFLEWFNPAGNEVGQLDYPTYTSPLQLPAQTIAEELTLGAGTASGTVTPAPFSITVRIDDILGSGDAAVRYSSDYGVTVGSPVTVGATPGFLGDFDLLRIGAATIAAADGQVKLATTLGGSYSNALGGTLSSGQPVTLALPFRRWDHGARQDDATDPDYLLGSSVAISGSCLWKVDGSSGAQTDVNPVSGAVCIGPHLATVWQSSATCKLAIVVMVSGIYKLYTSVDGGASWTFRRNVGNPLFLRCRRNDLYGTQLYLIDNASLYISTDWGVSWKSRTLPSATPGVFLDSYN